MGRKKIKIARINDDKTRNTTFKKRKDGLFKKAIELSLLCHAPVYVIVGAPMADIKNGTFYQYKSQNMVPEIMSSLTPENTVTFNEIDLEGIFANHSKYKSPKTEIAPLPLDCSYYGKRGYDEISSPIGAPSSLQDQYQLLLQPQHLDYSQNSKVFYSQETPQNNTQLISNPLQNQQSPHPQESNQLSQPFQLVLQSGSDFTPNLNNNNNNNSLINNSNIYQDIVSQLNELDALKQQIQNTISNSNINLTSNSSNITSKLQQLQQLQILVQSCGSSPPTSSPMPPSPMPPSPSDYYGSQSGSDSGESDLLFSSPHIFQLSPFVKLENQSPFS